MSTGGESIKTMEQYNKINLVDVGFCLSLLCRKYPNLPVIDPYDPANETEALIRIIAITDYYLTYGTVFSLIKSGAVYALEEPYINTMLNGERRVRDFKRSSFYPTVLDNWEIIWNLAKYGSD